MRALIVVWCVVFCLSTLQAEGIDDRDVEVFGEYLDGILRGGFYDQIFLLELDYDLATSNASRVLFSWPVAENWRSPWRVAFEAVPPVWSSDFSRDIGSDPIKPDEYRAGGQFLAKAIDVRLLWPMARTIHGRTIDPYLELRRLQLYQLDKHTEIFARGRLDPNQAVLGLGIARQCGALEGKVIYDTSNQLSWSLGFRTRISPGL